MGVGLCGLRGPAASRSPLLAMVIPHRRADHRLRLARLAKRASSTRIAYACNGFIGVHRLASLSAAALAIAALAFRTTTEVSSGRSRMRLMRGALRNTGHTLSANRPLACTRFANHTRPAVSHSMKGSSLARSMLMQLRHIVAFYRHLWSDRTLGCSMPVHFWWRVLPIMSNRFALALTWLADLRE